MFTNMLGHSTCTLVFRGTLQVNYNFEAPCMFTSWVKDQLSLSPSTALMLGLKHIYIHCNTGRPQAVRLEG